LPTPLSQGGATVNLVPLNIFYADKLAGIDDEVLARIFDDEKLARIVAAQGAPGQIDLNALRRKLMHCVVWYAKADASGYHHARKHAISTKATIKRLKTQLQHEIFRTEATELRLQELLLRLDAFDKWIDSDKLEIKAKEYTKKVKRLAGITRSPTQSLVGLWLPPVYQDIFKQPATASEPLDGGPPDTPYVRFARQVAKEMGIRKCSPHLIRKALTQYPPPGKTSKRAPG
jgi:hypothetical protein